MPAPRKRKKPAPRKKAPPKEEVIMIQGETSGKSTPLPVVPPNAAPPLRIVSYYPYVVPHTRCPHCDCSWSKIIQTKPGSPKMRYHECMDGHKYRSREV